MENYSKIIQDVNSLIAEGETEYSSGEKKAVVDRNFEITHREIMIRYIRAKASNDVKAHLLATVRLDCGLYIGTLEETSKATGITKRTVGSSFRVLQDGDFIRFYRNGIWAVNPKLLRKGTGGKYIGQIRFYYSIPQKFEE